MLTACSEPRTEEFWMQKENWEKADYAAFYCSGRTAFAPKVEPKFDKEKECVLIKKIHPKIKSNLSKVNLEKSNILKVKDKWKYCTDSYYPYSDKEYCSWINNLMESKAKEVAPELSSWQENNLKDQHNACREDFFRPKLDEDKFFCVAISYYYNKKIEKKYKDEILAWKKKVDKYSALTKTAYQSTIETPCGSKSGKGYELYSRRTGVEDNTIYNWSDCKAWINAGKYIKRK